MMLEILVVVVEVVLVAMAIVVEEETSMFHVALVALGISTLKLVMEAIFKWAEATLILAITIISVYIMGP